MTGLFDNDAADSETRTESGTERPAALAGMDRDASYQELTEVAAAMDDNQVAAELARLNAANDAEAEPRWWRTALSERRRHLVNHARNAEACATLERLHRTSEDPTQMTQTDLDEIAGRLPDGGARILAMNFEEATAAAAAMLDGHEHGPTLDPEDTVVRWLELVLARGHAAKILRRGEAACRREDEKMGPRAAASPALER